MDESIPGVEESTAHVHRRLNLLTGEWVLVSPHRTQRPWQGQKEKTGAPNVPRHDPDCYLCPGGLRAGGARNPDYKDVFVFDNDFPSMLPRSGKGIPDSMGWHGAPFLDDTLKTHWTLHAHFYPPLLRSATVKKFMVGYEMPAEPQRDITPEQAAEWLRQQPETALKIHNTSY